MSNDYKTLSEKAIEHARLITSINDAEHNLALQRRDCNAIECSISKVKHDCADAVVLELTDHGFAQAMSRFEQAIMKHPDAYNSVYNEPVHASILSPSGFKAFIITILASSFKNNNYQVEVKSEGKQYKYTVSINKWKTKSNLEFVAIVKKNKLITGFFNWN